MFRRARGSFNRTEFWLGKFFESLDVFHELTLQAPNMTLGGSKATALVVVDSTDLNPEQFQQGLA
jgi:hypothetical protein